MSALQARYFDLHRFQIGRCRFEMQLPCSDGIFAAGTADGNFAFFFRVEIQEHFAFQHFRRKVAGSGEAGLFIDGKQKFQRTVFEGTVFHDGQVCCNADAVVGAESCTVCHKKVAFANKLNRILQEVVNRVLVLFADHVEVGLERDRTNWTPSRSCHAPYFSPNRHHRVRPRAVHRSVRPGARGIEVGTRKPRRKRPWTSWSPRSLPPRR